MSNKKKKHSQNNKSQAVETNSTTASSTAPVAEFNSYSTSQSLSYYYFGLDILELYDTKQLMAMIRDPMGHNKELREIARTRLFLQAEKVNLRKRKIRKQ